MPPRLRGRLSRRYRTWAGFAIPQDAQTPPFLGTLALRHIRLQPRLRREVGGLGDSRQQLAVSPVAGGRLLPRTMAR